MALRSARLSGDPVLQKCLDGTHRMFEPESSLSVMRVQEGLRALGFFAGKLDGFFGPVTGAAVSDFKDFHDIFPTDPVVGPGTAQKLDDELFVDPPNLDPAFGEVAGFVTRHVMEPFIGLELAPLIDAPLDSMRHDVGSLILSTLDSGFLVGIVAASRASDLVGDPRIPPPMKASLAALGPAAGRAQPFVGTDGLDHEVVIIDDLTVRSQRTLIHRPSGRKNKVDLQEVLCHEMTHVLNGSSNLSAIPDSDSDTFLDTALAADRTDETGFATARVFNQFASEMNARHVAFIIKRELAGDPFAARFLPPAALVEAAHFYFAETDPVFIFDDNGYIQTILSRGHEAKFRQIALWLRQVSKMSFSTNPLANDISAQLFRDAADSADVTAANPAVPRPPGDGLFPGDKDFV